MFWAANLLFWTKIMTQETALGAALKSAVQTLSKRQQTQLVSDYIYKKYDVLNRCRPLALDTEQHLIEALPQFDPQIVSRVLANHCRRPKYLVNVAMGGKRFNLQGRFDGKITPEEQQYALEQPNIADGVAKLQARLAAKKAKKSPTAETISE